MTTDSSAETYVGLTAGQFKDRFYKHSSDFEKEDMRNATKLSSYIWKLKDENKPYQIKWGVVKRAYSYSGKCDLCTAEKYEIIYNPQSATLNSRNELFSA